MNFVWLTDLSCFWTSSLVVDSEEGDRTTKDFLALTFLTSDQPASEVKSPGCDHGNLTSIYHNIVSLRVPIAKAESDFETPDNDDDDDEDDEDEEDEAEKDKDKHSQVNTVLFFYFTSNWTAVRWLVS